MAFSWLPGLVALCTHKDDSTDNLALYLPTYKDFKLTVSEGYCPVVFNDYFIYVRLINQVYTIL